MMKKIFLTTLLCCLLVTTCNLHAQAPNPSTTPETFRDPFTVKFQFDSKHKFERKFEKTAYVSEKTISIFPNEEFGISVKGEGEEVTEVSYEPDVKKANVTFKFEVQKLGKHSAMMLTIQSKLEKMLVMEGWMLLPEYKEAVKTSLAPVLPHLFGVETWPQPILKLELKNLRFAPAPKGLTGTAQ